MPPISIAIEKTTQKTIDITLSPTHNIFGSMIHLVKADEMPGIHEWITKVRQSITPEQLADTHLALIGLHYVVLPDDGQITFPAYINNLEKTDPILLRDKMLDVYLKIGEASESDNQSVDWTEILATPNNYINFLKSRFPDYTLDEGVEKRAYEYVIDPPAMKDFIVKHMTWLWSTFFEAEWNRVEPILLESIRSFNNFDISSMSRIEAANFIIGQDVSEAKWCQHIDDKERIEFVPNPHNGPYITPIFSNNTMYILFGARQPEGVDDRIPELDRTEIVSRLSALADNTRLHILQLTAERGEIRVQDILEDIELSQPSVSRYLTQLTSTGYLNERRENGAKVYSLNQDRIRKTLKAVSAFLLGQQ